MTNYTFNAASELGGASTLDTTTSTAGNSVFSRLRQAKSIIDQIRGAQSVVSLPSNVQDYPAIITPDGKRYLLESHFSTRARTSWVSQHGTWLLRVSPNGNDTDGAFWCCNRCSKLFKAQATSGAIAHLRKDHSVSEDGEASTTTTTTTTMLKRAGNSIAEMVQEHAAKRVKLPVPKSQEEAF
jgi:hypothetical protein